MFKDYDMQRAINLRKKGKKIKVIAAEIGRCERTVYNVKEAPVNWSLELSKCHSLVEKYNKYFSL